MRAQTAVPSGEIIVEFDVEAPMRDGTVLRCNVFRPFGDGRWPVLVVRVPYGKDAPGLATSLDPVHAARRGYAVVVQDTRGRFASDGRHAAYRNDGRDGADTVAWAAAAAWSDGRVGMFGTSYSGVAQLLAARERPKALRAIAPMNSWRDPFDGYWYRGGVLELGRCAQQALSMGLQTVARDSSSSPAQRRRRAERLTDELDRLAATGYASSPPADFLPLRGTGVGAELFDAVAAADDPQQESVVTLVDAPGVGHVPALCIGGWFDVFLQGTLDTFQVLRRHGVPARMILGPWTHLVQRNPIGERSFGMASQATGCDLQGEHVRWFDTWLARRREHDPQAPSVRLFVMGINRWRDEQDWPLARAVDTAYHLRQAGGLTQELPADEPADTYMDDRRAPVPPHGGAILMAPDFVPGPRDQGPVERRPDVLTFSTSPLETETEVTGPVRARLWVRSTGTSADFVVRLCDVDPSGRSTNLTDGIVRVAFDAPDRPVLADVDLWATSNVFQRGHRIRVQVASSCFPRWASNPRDAPCVRNWVLHDQEHPSRIVLPVVR